MWFRCGSFLRKRSSPVRYEAQASLAAPAAAAAAAAAMAAAAAAATVGLQGPVFLQGFASGVQIKSACVWAGRRWSSARPTRRRCRSLLQSKQQQHQLQWQRRRRRRQLSGCKGASFFVFFFCNVLLVCCRQRNGCCRQRAACDASIARVTMSRGVCEGRSGDLLVSERPCTLFARAMTSCDCAP